jgi:CDP-diacylglycerol--serine O-phosphatidyltransferase
LNNVLRSETVFPTVSADDLEHQIAGDLRAFPALRHVNLANIVTSLSMVASVSGILLAIENRMLAALLVGAVTLPCDVLDGILARRRNTASAFGSQLDCFADAIGFGVMPALFGYVLGVQGIATLVLIGYVLGAVWRLAHFQQAGFTSMSYGREVFQGMPTTFAAALFYVVVAISLWAPRAPGRIALILFFALAPVLMNRAFAFPKRGWHTRCLWVLVPVGLLTLFFRQW